MQIFGLYGKSGTGKSHKSMEVLAKYQIDAMIDDGLLIIDKMRIAGSSAKYERYMHAATKKAIFHSEEHRREVSREIQARNIRRLLIIGTSQKMIMRIVERLDLPRNVQWIPVEQFQSEEELKIARERRSKGYHIIPVQPIEVEKTYSGWFRKFIVRFGKRKEEVTLIKPIYSENNDMKTMFAGGGKIMIHPQAIRKMIKILSRDEDKLILHSIAVEDERIFVVVSVPYGETVQYILEWRERIAREMRKWLGIPYAVHVEWKRIVPHPKRSGIRADEVMK